MRSAAIIQRWSVVKWDDASAGGPGCLSCDTTETAGKKHLALCGAPPLLQSVRAGLCGRNDCQEAKPIIVCSTRGAHPLHSQEDDSSMDDAHRAQHGHEGSGQPGGALADVDCHARHPAD